MAVTRETVEQVARLAGIQLDEEELEDYRRTLGRIIEYMDRLQGLPLEASAPAAYPGTGEAPLREDEPRSSGESEELLAGAPLREGPYLAVPLVVSRADR